MTLFKDKINVRDVDGNTIEVDALCETTQSRNIDQPSPSLTKIVRFVVIDGEEIPIEGLGYFTHPKTGKKYEL